MLPGYICMEKIIFLGSDCESWGGQTPLLPPLLSLPWIALVTCRYIATLIYMYRNTGTLIFFDVYI